MSRSRRARRRRPQGQARKRARAEPAPEAPGFRTGRWLLGIFLVAFGLRLFAWYAATPTPWVGDEPEYFARGKDVCEGRTIRDEGKRPPVNWTYYGVVFKVFGVSPAVARAANVPLSLLTLFPVFYLGRRFGDNRTGLWAAGIAAVYPNFVAYSHFLWPATIYVLLSALGLCVLVWHWAKPAVWKAAIAGVLFGFGALTREMGAAFPPFAACWLIWSGRKRLRKAVIAAAVFLFACGLTILPWTLRINRHSDHFALLSYTAYLNLYIGNGSKVQLVPDGPWISPKYHYRTLGRTRSERELAARELALEAIRDRMPWWPFDKLRRSVPKFFTPNSFAVLRLLASPETRLSEWAYKLRPEWLNARAARVVLIVAAAGAYVAVAVAGIAGFVLARHRILAVLFGTFIVSQVLPTVITFACSRFRLGCMPVFIVAAAWVLSQRRRLWTTTTWRGRIAAAVCAMAMLLLISVTYRTLLKPAW